MTRLLPNAEPNGYTPMPSELGLQSGGRVHRASRIRETRHWFFVGLDDARWDYSPYGGVGAVLQAGDNGCLRSGQLVMQSLYDRVMSMGTTFLSHRTTLGPCWTARAEWHTGLFYGNHGMGAHDTTVTDYIAEYGNTYVDGIKTNEFVTINAQRSVDQWMGPWGKDLALKHGYGRQRVTNATQSSDGVLRDSDDDVQAFSGAIWQQLDREGVAVGFFGKLSNPRDRTDPIPAGIARAVIQLEDGPNSPVTDDAQYNLWFQDFDMNTAYDGGNQTLNPFDGDGYDTLGNYSTSTYPNKPVQTLTWVGGTATVTLLTSIGGTALSAGDQITITGNTSGYNGTWTLTGGNGLTTFTFATPTSGGGGGGTLYPRANFAPFLYWKKCKAWLDALTDAQPFYVNMTSRLPHDNNGNYFSSTSEKEYSNAVDPTTAIFYGGVSGASNPVNASLSSTEQDNWQDCMQMMASIDDLIKLIADYADGRWGTDGWGIIFTSDQGIQNGDQGASYTNADGQSISSFGDGSGKTFFWDSSARTMLHIRGPHFGSGTHQSDVTQPTVHADVSLTLLDLFDITDSHWHLTRDGRSLMRVTDSGDLAHNRMVPVFGDWKTGAGGGNHGFGIVDKTGRKFVELNNLKSSGKFLYPDPNVGAVTYNSSTVHPAYEQAQVTPTSGDLTTYDNALQAALAFRFDITSETHPAHTTASP